MFNCKKLIVLFLLLITSPIFAENHVLELDGDGDYLKLPSGIFKGLEQATIEGWFKWKRLDHYPQFVFFDFGNRNEKIALASFYDHRNTDLFFQKITENGAKYTIDVANILRLNQWCHFATVFGENVVKLYLNGILIEEGYYPGSFSTIGNKTSNFIGYSNVMGYDMYFQGQVDEIRVWKTTRTTKQIRELMFSTLHGQEKGLHCYWNFDKNSGFDIDSSHKKWKAQLSGDVNRIPSSFPISVHFPSVVTGYVHDQNGKPVAQANVALKQGSKTYLKTSTNTLGKFRMISWLGGTFDIYATLGNSGRIQNSLYLDSAETSVINLILQQARSISGQILHLNSITPHASTQVQAVLQKGGQEEGIDIVATTLSDKNGFYQFVNLKPGQYQVRCYTNQGYVYHKSGQKVTVTETSTSKNVDFILPAFKRGHWKTYTRFDGLASNSVRSIHQDKSGMIWLATDQGVCRYDGEIFETFTKTDGLSGNNVWDIYQHTNGDIWFGTSDGGICRFNGYQFESFPDLNEGGVRVIEADASGNIWFAGGYWLDQEGKGLWCFDGQRFIQFTTKDGLVLDKITSLHCADDGTVWAGHVYGGISRYHPPSVLTEENRFSDLSTSGMGKFTSYTPEVPNQYGPDGLTGTTSHVIEQSADGRIWLGGFEWDSGQGGLSIYDGNSFATLTTEDGLPSGAVDCIFPATDGVMWMGTGGRGQHLKGGVARYDGKGLVIFTTADGLVSNQVFSIYQTSNGAFWFGTDKGVSVYHPTEFHRISEADGLVNNDVTVIHRDPDGVFWFGTKGGISKYDGKHFANFTIRDGLLNNHIVDIERVEVALTESNRQSELWFSSRRGGISRYTEQRFIPFTPKQGLLHDQLGGGLASATDGRIWIGVWSGVSVYDGKSAVLADGDFSEMLIHFRPSDGLINMIVLSLMPDENGGMWIGTGGGLSYYDGYKFTNYSTANGLTHNAVKSIFRQDNGTLIIGTAGGVSKFDGDNFTKLGNGINGSPLVNVNKIYRSPDGILWLATNKGVVLYDDGVWSSLDVRDGLAGDEVRDIYVDSNDRLWFATDAGVTRYQRLRHKLGLGVRIISIQTDIIHTEMDSLPPITVGQRMTLNYRAIDFKSVREKRQYKFQLRAVDGKTEIEEQVTSVNKIDHIFKQPGDYIFEVAAIDRDLFFSEVTHQKLTVLPTWYMNGWIIIPSGFSISMILVLGLANGIRYYQQKRESERLELESQQLQEQMLAKERETRVALEAELADAHDMQMALLPESAPVVSGLQIAGQNIAAKEVGGDFFDYLEGHELVKIAVGDVSGKGLKGAMNAVMTSSILNLSAEHQDTLSELMSEVNKSLCQSMEQDMNVTMVLAEFDTQEKSMILVNAGQHAYPLLKRGASIEPVKAKGLALGMIPSIPYKSLTLDLQSGDLLLLMTDGITEPRNAAGLMYEESGRFHEVISELSDELSAEEVVETIIQDVINYMVDEEELTGLNEICL